MDQQASQHPPSAQPARGRSPSAGPGHQQPDIRNSHSPSPHPYQHQPLDPSTIGLGLGIDPSASSNPDPLLATAATSDFSDPNAFLNTSSPQPQSYTAQGISDVASFASSNPDLSQSCTSQAQVGGFDQNSLVAPEFSDGDFSLFPPASNPGDSFNNNAPLFGELSPTNNNSLDPADFSNMTSPQTHHSPTPPHLLKLDPGAPNQPPAFNQNPFGTSPGHRSHSRNTSLGPESALLPNQVDWNQSQFHTHRRSPSEYSDVSSAAPSPNLAGSDSFDPQDPGHSPLQQSQDGLYQDVMGLSSFTLSDTRMAQPGRSPSHSPAMSPRLHPTQQIPDSMLLNTGYPMPPPPSIHYPVEQFPSFPPEGSYVQDSAYPQEALMGPSMAPPSINIDYAPNAKQGGYEPPKGAIDEASLTPPDRGRIRNRPRAVTDPYNSGGGSLSRPATPGGLSPHMSANMTGRNRAGSESSAPRSVSPASLSPESRSGSQSAASRRRQSMTSVPNNVIALRLADPEYQAAQDSGNTKRVQKHPATFQCTLCPKRFTRAYNLRSHLRTHTDERPFVCTVCGKAFARQHDRKRHEGLHSGEKKFVCKGDLKAGGQWGCGRRFARADALGRHFRSEAGRICIKPLLDEEMIERQRQWEEQRMQTMQNMGQGAVMDPGMYPPPMEPNNTFLPAALLAQYPALAQMNWAQNDMGNVDEEVSGRSSFDNSDYDEEGGYVSGPGTGFGDGGLQQGFGEVGYSSDYGGR